MLLPASSRVCFCTDPGEGLYSPSPGMYPVPSLASDCLPFCLPSLLLPFAAGLAEQLECYRGQVQAMITGTETLHIVWAAAHLTAFFIPHLHLMLYPKHSSVLAERSRQQEDQLRKWRAQRAIDTCLLEEATGKLNWKEVVLLVDVTSKLLEREGFLNYKGKCTL